MVIQTIWNSQTQLAKLEDKREKMRPKRMTFDCFHARVRVDRVICEKYQLLSPSSDGSMSLLACLRGVLSGSCKKCKYFEGDINDEMPINPK